LLEPKDVVGIAGRLQYDGGELSPLDEDGVRAAALRAQREGYGDLAV